MLQRLSILHPDQFERTQTGPGNSARDNDTAAVLPEMEQIMPLGGNIPARQSPHAVNNLICPFFRGALCCCQFR
jgi:hypothetical protein